MNNCTGTLLSFFLVFFLVFQMFSLILIEHVMSRNLLRTIFATLGQLAAKILVNLYVYPLAFL